MASGANIIIVEDDAIRLHDRIFDTTTFPKDGLMFKEGLAGLVKKGKTVTEMKEAMFYITNLILTREFGDETGKITWKTTLQKKIDTIKEGKICEEARADARKAEADRLAEAARKAEADRLPADAAMHGE